MKNLKIGVIGCGGIGVKRANFRPANFELIACHDVNEKTALSFSRAYNCQVTKSWQDLLMKKEIDAVIIATPHNVLAEIAESALKESKHIFLEKPAGLNSHEIERLIGIREEVQRIVHVGFNHRYHRAVQKAFEIIRDGMLGELMFIRGRYGHGGRVGYEKEWRSNPKLSGGGELMDQGPHLIDLSRVFLGEFVEVDGYAHTYYWDAPVEDNAFMTLKTFDKKVAFLHVSSCEWKNIFSMEIYGKKGKLEISGLGGSYGVERLTLYQMLPEMGPPPTFVWEYPMADNSWGLELEEFSRAIIHNNVAGTGLEDALASHRVIEKIYKVSGYDYYT